MNTSKHFLHLLDEFSKSNYTALPELSAEESRALLALAKEQSVSGITAYMLNHSAARRAPVLTNDKAIMQRYCEQVYQYGRLTELLERSGIFYLPIKGINISKLYPIPELREMGDIDIVIHPEDMELIDNLFQDLGFQKCEAEDFDVSFKRGCVTFEIHPCLFPGMAQKSPLFPEYFSSRLWRRAVRCKETFCCCLPPEDEFILMIVHMAEHFSNFSCGIRFFLDLAVYLNHYGRKLDYSYIEKELQSLSLDRFYYSMLHLTNRYFTVSVQETIPSSKLSKEQRAQLLEMILSGGTFGYLNNNLYSDIVKDTRLKESKSIGIAGTIYRKIFMPRTVWKKDYPYLKRNPLLYPKAFLHRTKRALHRRKLGTLLRVHEGLREGEKRSNLLKNIGL